jgi:UDP-N-acetylglucosamine diphosphorylase/glucosamine-1-phosphate N-acetyltransferase
VITADHLHGFEEPDAAPVVRLHDIGTSDTRVFLSSRAVLDWTALRHLPTGAALLSTGSEIVGCVLPAGTPNPDAGWITRPGADGAQVVEVAGRVLTNVWDLVAENPGQITRDYSAMAMNGTSAVPAGCDVVGDPAGALLLGADVALEPGVVLDFSHGPIWLADGVTIRAFTRLAGPAYVGPRSTLLGGPYEGISIGPVCRVHGEVEESVILGYSNKAHDGFLGHAYLGRWVNLGALTTNSDLKNNYGTIRMWTPDGERDTGLIKLGCLLGDHVKTGIGALLNTGTVIGAGCNLFGTAMPPKDVAPFSWGSGSDLVAFDVERFLDVTATVMARRDLVLGDGMRTLLRNAWEHACGSSSTGGGRAADGEHH